MNGLDLLIAVGEGLVLAAAIYGAIFAIAVAGALAGVR